MKRTFARPLATRGISARATAGPARQASHTPDAAVGPLGLLLSLLATVTLAVPAHAHAPGVVLSGVGTATIDGVVRPGEWLTAGCTGLSVKVPEGGTTPGTVCAMNDATNLYLLVLFARSAADRGNTAAFEFDNDHDGGVRVTGDDVLLINPAYGSRFYDEVRTTAPPCPLGALCGLWDTSVGGTNDGAGAFTNDGAFSMYEFAHPLNSADDLNDFSLSPGDTVGFTLFVRIMSAAGYADTYFPTAYYCCTWFFGDIVIASPVLPVAIDIKPGTFPNTINRLSRGSTRVAILSTATFDAPARVAPSSLTFGRTGDESSLAFCSPSPEDVNGDGLLDVVCHFATSQSGFQPGDTVGVLKGTTMDGTAIVGSDSVLIMR